MKLEAFLYINDEIEDSGLSKLGILLDKKEVWLDEKE
jgi:hypothetical protein